LIGLITELITMTLTANQQTIENLYEEVFGASGAGTRSNAGGGYADFNTTGGAQYWADKLGTEGHSADQIKTMLQNSAEAQSGHIGGVNPNVSIASQLENPNSSGYDWLSGQQDAHNVRQRAAGTNDLFDPASLLNTITGNVSANTSNPYFNQPGSNLAGGGGQNIDTSNFLTSGDLDSWWAGKNQNDGGMGDFMKFMMLMSVMRGGMGGFGGMGGMGGYGGSQYGYGGLNPGGVMQSQDPLAMLQGMSTWFKDNFGSGGGATTGTVNTGTGTGNSGN
jgi:hypothetical protein